MHQNRRLILANYDRIPARPCYTRSVSTDDPSLSVEAMTSESKFHEEYKQLTPEEKEKLRRQLVKLCTTVALPQVKSSSSTAFTSVSRIILEMARPQLGHLRASIPAVELAAQAAKIQQMPVVNGDIFKNFALIQANINATASRLAQTLDFGPSEALKKAFSRYLIPAGAGFKSVLAKFPNIPPNLREIDTATLGEIERVVIADGIPLYGVPSRTIAEALIQADDTVARRQILEKEWESISQHCRSVIDECYTDSVASYRSYATVALNSLDAGFVEAAQAMAATLIDAITNSYFGSDRSKYTPGKNTKTMEAYQQFGLLKRVALAPLWQAYQQFWPAKGYEIPGCFNRHATAHTIDPRQYTRTNAVHGLMFACSLIYRLDEEAKMYAEDDEEDGSAS